MFIWPIAQAMTSIEQLSLPERKRQRVIGYVMICFFSVLGQFVVGAHKMGGGCLS